MAEIRGILNSAYLLDDPRYRFGFLNEIIPIVKLAETPEHCGIQFVAEIQTIAVIKPQISSSTRFLRAFLVRA